MPAGQHSAAWRVAAVLLAAATLQACGSANVLAALDGPYIPPSERGLAQRPSEAEIVAATIAELAPPPAAPETAPAVEVEVAAADPEFVGPVLAAGTGELPAVRPNVVQLNVPAPEAGPAPAAAPPARVGRDFMAPAPAQPAPAPAAVIAPDRGGPIGPALPGPQAPVQLATRLPSAFDYAPPPVVAAQPAPAPVAAAEPAPAPTPTPFAAFHRYALDRLAGNGPGNVRRSMLLADPASLDPALQACGTKPPAVLIDLDPANSLLPLVAGNRADQQLGALLVDLRTRGVAVYWISGHSPGAASAIRQQLTASMLDPTGNDPLIVARFASETKQQRRRALGETHCLLAVLGDSRSDFDELYDYLRDPGLADPLEVLIGHGWFLAPNPLG
jgi:hypothetical protein